MSKHMYLVIEEGDHVREDDLLGSLRTKEHTQLGSTVLQERPLHRRILKIPNSMYTLNFKYKNPERDVFTTIVCVAHSCLCTINYSTIPYSGKLWRALNLANQLSECIGEF